MPNGGSFTIYAEPANINYFLNNALDADTVDGPSNGQVNVAAHTRQSYPGDPSPQQVASSQREYLIDPSRKSGNALPGKTFVLAQVGEDGAIAEKRTFTYKGRWLDLHSFLGAEAKYDMYAYNHTGARSTIPSAAPPSGG